MNSMCPLVARVLAVMFAVFVLQSPAFAGEATQAGGTPYELSGSPGAVSPELTRVGGAYGGWSGSYFRLNCAPGSVAVGIHGSAGTFIDHVALICAPVVAPGVMGGWYLAGQTGGWGGSGYWLNCEQGFAIEAIEGQYSSFIDNIGIRCRKLDGTLSYQGPSAGGTGGVRFSDPTVIGEFLTGIEGAVDSRHYTNGIVTGIKATYSRVP
jgi:hypothetical protein